MAAVTSQRLSVRALRGGSNKDVLPCAAPHPPTHLCPMIRVWPHGACGGLV